MRGKIPVGCFCGGSVLSLPLLLQIGPWAAARCFGENMTVTCSTGVWKHLPEAQGRAAGPWGSACSRVPRWQKADGGVEHAAVG